MALFLSLATLSKAPCDETAPVGALLSSVWPGRNCARGLTFDRSPSRFRYGRTFFETLPATCGSRSPACSKHRVTKLRWRPHLCYATCGFALRPYGAHLIKRGEAPTGYLRTTLRTYPQTCRARRIWFVTNLRWPSHFCSETCASSRPTAHCFDVEPNCR